MTKPKPKDDLVYFDLFNLKFIKDPTKEGTKTDIQYELESKKKNTKKGKGMKIREYLFSRDGNQCFYSGRPMTKDNATIEHLIPLSKGGRNCKENLVLCLSEHNSKVGNSSLAEKLQYRDFLMKQKKDSYKEIESLKIQLTNAFRKIETTQKEVKLKNEQITSLQTKLKEIRKLLMQ
jgi:hypothetical protein